MIIKYAALAACDTDSATRETALRAALDAARTAVDQYRDEFDAVAMATMQFNVAFKPPC